MNDRILVVNAGSSSLKFQVHEILPTQQLALIMGGQVSGIGGSRPAFKVKNQAGELLLDTVLTPAQAADLATAQQIMAAWLQDRMPAPPLAVGHRIVHGGREMSRSVLISQEILEYLAWTAGAGAVAATGRACACAFSVAGG